VSAFTIGLQPQTLFLDGEQSNVTLTNDGPFTIYLDENGSVSATTSMPLPPLASVPWRANRPLWVVASGNSSTLRMARTDAAPATPGDGKQRLLYQNRDTMPTQFTSRIETGSYQSLFLVWATDSTTRTTIELAWYSTDGVYLRTTRYQPAIASAVTVLRATVPVNGAFVVISSTGVDSLTSLTVTGSTAALQTAMYPQFDGQYDVIPIDISVSTLLQSYGADYVQFLWDAATLNTVKLHQRGTRLAMNMHFSALPSETGTVELQDARTGLRIGAAIQIVTTSADYNQVWDVPLSIGYQLVVTNVVATPTNPSVSLVWSP